MRTIGLMASVFCHTHQALNWNLLCPSSFCRWLNIKWLKVLFGLVQFISITKLFWQATKAELHAVKLENRHLHCGTLLENGGNLLEADKTESDCHLIELQNAYAESVKTLQVHSSIIFFVFLKGFKWSFS